MIAIPLKKLSEVKNKTAKLGDVFFFGFDLEQYPVLDLKNMPKLRLNLKGQSNTLEPCIQISVASYESEQIDTQTRPPSIHQGPIKYAFDKEIDVTWDEITRSGPGFERFFGVFFEVLDDCFIEEIKASFFIEDPEQGE